MDLIESTPATDPAEEGNLPLNMPVLHTCKAPCIHNDGKCTGMLTTERLSILLEGYNAAKAAGLHNMIQPPVQEPATNHGPTPMPKFTLQHNPFTTNPKVNISNTLVTPQICAQHSSTQQFRE